MMEIANYTYGTPEKYPISERPRLLFRKKDIPAIRAALCEDIPSNANFLQYIDSTIENDCVLSATVAQSANEEHNFSAIALHTIQAKALAYLLYDDKYYGYQAILYIKNYMKSLDIIKRGDQCRYYGFVMYTAALVYDWCYDLLTETDKIQFIAGAENCLCRDDQSKKVHKSKMEVLFPPRAESGIVGHGNEYQVLRDYLSFSIAIYGDNNSWYEYVGGRVYNEFVPARNYLYRSGNIWQGTGYAFTRHVPSLISAWILKIATGENPYSDVLPNAIRGFFNYEVTPGYVFSEGDYGGDLHQQTKCTMHAYLAAYLYDDPSMMAMFEYLVKNHYDGLNPFSTGSCSEYGGLNDVAHVIINGLCKTKSNGNRYKNMELIKYYGGHLGQYVVREAWENESSPAVYMRIKERVTGGHEHMDAGTFNIYYKGVLTNDGGVYNHTSHHHYYHMGTISHNSLIIYNPAFSDTESGWYSGGQKRPKDDTTGIRIEKWRADPQFTIAKVTGRQHAYVDDTETKPHYAYIAGDITGAYDAETVSYVGRRMLTVYTGDKKFPMAFFVFDDISAISKDFEKRFLLQITSPDKPTVNGNKIITENGEGRLVLTSLSDGVKIVPLGGKVYTSEGIYDGVNSTNYLVNGKQLAPAPFGVTDKHWGRIEIVSTPEKKDATFMNVLYVTDKGNTESADVIKITDTKGVEGGVFNEKIAAIFSTARDCASEAISFSASGNNEMDYYVSGLAAGEWNVSVDGKDCGTYTATAEGGLLTFTAPDGKVEITPVK